MNRHTYIHIVCTYVKEETKPIARKISTQDTHPVYQAG